jgi:hypothetical protein
MVELLNYDKSLEMRLMAEFQKAIIELQKMGYTPTHFKKMLSIKGAVDTVNFLLGVDKYSEGITRIWELKALYLSMEAIIIKEPYCQLFTENQLKVARKRLKDLGYEFD